MKPLVAAKTLVIAEETFGRVGHRPRTDARRGKFENTRPFRNEQYVVSSAVGHLVEIRRPEDVKPRQMSLPICRGSPHFDLKPIDKSSRASRRRQTGQAQGCRRADQRLRRRARGRADLPA